MQATAAFVFSTIPIGGDRNLSGRIISTMRRSEIFVQCLVKRGYAIAHFDAV